MLMLLAVLLGSIAVTLAGWIAALRLMKKWPPDFSGDKPAAYQACASFVETALLLAGLIYVGLQAIELKKGVAVSTVQQMVDSHRELLGMMVEKPEIFRALDPNFEPAGAPTALVQGDLDPQVMMYQSMLYNHAFNAFELRRNGYINAEWWTAIVVDMQDLLGREALRTRWKTIQKFYPPRFRSFINRQIHVNKESDHAPN